MQRLDEACEIWLPKTELWFGTPPPLPHIRICSCSLHKQAESEQTLRSQSGSPPSPPHDFPPLHPLIIQEPWRSWLSSARRGALCSKPCHFFSCVWEDKCNAWAQGHLFLQFSQGSGWPRSPSLLPSVPGPGSVHRSCPGPLAGAGFKLGSDATHRSLPGSEGGQTQCPTTGIK